MSFDNNSNTNTQVNAFTALLAKATDDPSLRQNAVFAKEIEKKPAVVQTIEKGGGRYSRHCADLVRFLSYGGFRVGEARNITWADCDLVREEIVVRGDPEEGTKNNEVRRVPMIGEMKALLERLRDDRRKEPPTASVMKVGECQIAMDTAAIGQVIM